ncbi:MAG: hypothetical protein COB37_03645 [Kordiimonadales bacterium]|nr:MAG: hypothetical protein COB37_03645 [Kordiimonadales bacterium]
MTAAKKYSRDFALAMVLYSVTLVSSILVMKFVSLPQWVTILVVLVPMLPVLLALKVVFTFVETMDELQKKIQGQAVLISFLLVGLATFTYGFAEGVGFPPLQAIFIFPALIGTWGAALVYVTRKYK